MWGQGSLTYKRIITLFVLHKEGKWNEILYIQMFIIFYQDRELMKICRVCVAIMSDELEDTLFTALARCKPPNPKEQLPLFNPSSAAEPGTSLKSCCYQEQNSLSPKL